MYTLDETDTQVTSKWTGSDIVKQNYINEKTKTFTIEYSRKLRTLLLSSISKRQRCI